jgi:hypothetical protein
MPSRHPFDPDNFRLPDTPSPDHFPETEAYVPRKLPKRREQFIQLPWSWFEQLKGTSGTTYHIALYLRYLHWKGNGAPIKLANGLDGVSRKSKWRALNELEERGLIAVERRPRKSPIVKLLLS